jgi:AP-3 complex subunit delta-1
VLQRREARKLEQANNPHYLKGELPINHATDALDLLDVPVAPLDLPVTLKIPGLASSEQYLKQQVSSKKQRKKKKEKKSKSMRK